MHPKQQPIRIPERPPHLRDLHEPHPRRRPLRAKTRDERLKQLLRTTVFGSQRTPLPQTSTLDPGSSLAIDRTPTVASSSIRRTSERSPPAPESASLQSGQHAITHLQMGANDERPLDLTPDEKSQVADMLARRGAADATGRLELEIVRGTPIGGWLHLRFGGATASSPAR